MAHKTFLYLRLFVVLSEVSQDKVPTVPPFKKILGHAARLAGSYFPDQGLNLHPQQWKHGVLTTGPSGHSLYPHFEDARLKAWEAARKAETKPPGAPCRWSVVIEPVAPSYHLKNSLTWLLNQGERALKGRREGSRY